MKFTHLLLWTQENKLSEKFYKKLGFEVIKSDDDHSIVKLGDYEMTLVNMRDEDVFANDSMVAHKGKGMYMYIEVDDVDETYSQLLKIGIKPSTEPKNWQWGNREFIVKDPDGYKLCFYKPIS